MRSLLRGETGEAVRDVQARLAALGFTTDADEPGCFGPGTESAVREFQQRRDLLVDGKVGPDTWQELVEAGYSPGDRILYVRYPALRGDDVRALQTKLNLLGFDAGREDGIFGERADRAVRDFQRNVGLPPDGIVGSTTLRVLLRLRPIGASAGFAVIRERESLRRLSPTTIRAARIAVDAGHGANDPGGVGPTGLREADAAFDLAESLARALRAKGAEPFLLRDRDADPPISERARAANVGGAEATISIHLNSVAGGDGATVFYCGREGWASASGRRLADLIQDELTALGLTDGRTHPKWLPLLRETRMPAVHVEPCFITNPEEERRLRSPDFREVLAEAIAAGVERFFVEPGEDAGPEGAMRADLDATADPASPAARI